MAAKTERIEMRTDPESGARIMQAARLEHMSVSAFVLEAATAAADRVLARHDHTMMPADQFDDMMAGLDVPDAAPGLARIASRPRRFTRS
jgi:uncharacterized protein (DUF1778 family)